MEVVSSGVCSASPWMKKVDAALVGILCSESCWLWAGPAPQISLHRLLLKPLLPGDQAPTTIQALGVFSYRFIFLPIWENLSLILCRLVKLWAFFFPDYPEIMLSVALLIQELFPKMLYKIKTNYLEYLKNRLKSYL